MKKQLLIGLIIFIIGSFTGGIIISSLSGNAIQQVWQAFEIQYRADTGNRVWQAYKEESPEIAIWALKNYIDILNKQVEEKDGYSSSLQTDLILAHVRLAIIYQQINDIENYDNNLAKGLTISKSTFTNKKYNKESLLDYIKQLDEIHNKNEERNTKPQAD